MLIAFMVPAIVQCRSISHAVTKDLSIHPFNIAMSDTTAERVLTRAVRPLTVNCTRDSSLTYQCTYGRAVAPDINIEDFCKSDQTECLRWKMLQKSSESL